MAESNKPETAAGAEAKKRGFWDRLTPGQKKMAVIGGAAAIVFSFFTLMNGNAQFSRGRTKPIENVLTDRSSRELGLDSLTAQIKIANDNMTQMRAENRQLKNQINDLRGQVQGTRDARRDTADLQRQIQSLQDQMSQSQSDMTDQIAKLSAENERLNKIVSAAPAISGKGGGQPQNRPAGGRQEAQGRQPSSGGRQETGGTPEIGDHSVPQGSSQSGSSSNLSGKPFLDRPVNTSDPYALYAQERKPEDPLASTGGEASAPADNTISVIAEPAKKSEAEAVGKQKPDLFLPTGTMLHGVLLSGLYAPTGVNARKDPFPVVLRVQDEAIMPNLRRADLRECFLTLSGYGDLSSERALLRGETMSCIANDDSIIEAKFPGYAVGEDGKAGIRGKLITRNGKALRNAMLAGFASGIGDAFQSNAVPKLDISSDGSTTYQAAFSTRTLNNGLFNGASEALNRLADYYMSLAEQTFPVIEVNAGRDVTVTLTQGTELTTVRNPDGTASEGRGGGTPSPAGGTAATEKYEHQPTPDLD
ncbi:MAG: TrbI/VirB10 family protein [Succinivibrio sp.]